jgi:mannosyl-3-phosphoglycerate phosphatase
MRLDFAVLTLLLHSHAPPSLLDAACIHPYPVTASAVTKRRNRRRAARVSRNATVLFSDVDGTLLDGEGRYAMTAAELAPHLEHLTIVLASSRTVLELSRNQRELGIVGPVVAENGAVVALPWSESSSLSGARNLIDNREWRVIKVGDSAAAIRDVIRSNAAELNTSYVDQFDIDASLGRECSVLLRPHIDGTWQSLQSLIDALTLQGFTVASGGSWLAVTRNADKAIGAHALMRALQLSGQAISRVAAVGDGDNDVSLLSMADDRFVIRRTDGTWHPDLRAISGVRCMLPVGIDGWRDVIEAISPPARYTS